ncbi:hypothetical protein HMN09_00318700 [Mycena chlorophos]|uniref:Uncharacterized protein n=1 Tax=Mycena chlorophos TaxID=658473 RepID=A0A8H6WKI7_MYCCL|nr:hypothetical protein HMN09_00318700 [Mycena chlorophos]
MLARPLRLAENEERLSVANRNVKSSTVVFRGLNAAPTSFPPPTLQFTRAGLDDVVPSQNGAIQENRVDQTALSTKSPLCIEKIRPSHSEPAPNFPDFSSKPWFVPRAMSATRAYSTARFELFGHSHPSTSLASAPPPSPHTPSFPLVHNACSAFKPLSTASALLRMPARFFSSAFSLNSSHRCAHRGRRRQATCGSRVGCSRPWHLCPIIVALNNDEKLVLDLDCFPVLLGSHHGQDQRAYICSNARPSFLSFVAAINVHQSLINGDQQRIAPHHRCTSRSFAVVSGAACVFLDFVVVAINSDEHSIGGDLGLLIAMLHAHASVRGPNSNHFSLCSLAPLRHRRSTPSSTPTYPAYAPPAVWSSVSWTRAVLAPVRISNPFCDCVQRHRLSRSWLRAKNGCDHARRRRTIVHAHAVGISKLCRHHCRVEIRSIITSENFRKTTPRAARRSALERPRPNFAERVVSTLRRKPLRSGEAISLSATLASSYLGDVASVGGLHVTLTWAGLQRISGFCGAAFINFPLALRRRVSKPYSVILRNGFRRVHPHRYVVGALFDFCGTVFVKSTCAAAGARKTALRRTFDFCGTVLFAVAPLRSRQDSRRDARIKALRAADLAALFFFFAPSPSDAGFACLIRGAPT